MNLLASIKQLLITSRPVGWLLFSGCFFAGYLYSGGNINLIVSLNFLAFTFPASLLVFGLNDLVDYQKDKLNKRKQNWLTGGVLEPKFHPLIISGIVISGIVLLCFPLFLRNLEMFIWVFLFIFLAYAYSFEPFRFKSRPFLEMFSNLAGTWLAVMVGLSYNLSLSEIITKLNPIFWAISFLILGIAFLSYVADFEADKATNESNLIQFFGQKPSLIISLICFGLSSFFITWTILKLGFLVVILLLFLQIFEITKYALSLVYQIILVYITLLFAFYIFYNIWT